MTNYRYVELYSDNELDRTGAHIVNDYITNRPYNSSRDTSVEEQLERLSSLVGDISDALGIDLLSIIDRHELRNNYKRKS